MEQSTLNKQTKYDEPAPADFRRRQHRANQRDVAYLAGIFDGEGHFSVARVNSKDTRYEHYQCHMGFTNSSMTLITKCQRIISRIISRRCPIVNHSIHEFSRVACFQVNVTHQAGVRLLCLALLDDLTAKKSQAMAMIKWIESRKANRHKRQGYTEFERGITARLKECRAEDVTRVGGRETKRLPPIMGAA